jgi:hypothetical protein
MKTKFLVQIKTITTIIDKKMQKNVTEVHATTMV